MNRRPIWRRYLARYKRYRWPIAVALATSILQMAFAVPVVALVGRVFDRFLPARDTRGLLWGGVAIAGLYLASALCAIWARRVTLDVTKRVISELRSDVFEKVQFLPRSWHDGQDRGILHARLVQDTERVDVMSNALVSQLLPSALIAGGMFFVLLWLSAPLTVLLLGIAVAIYVANLAVARRLRKRVDEFRDAFESFSAGALFLLEKLDLIHMHSAEDHEAARRREEVERLRLTSGRMAWLDSVFGLMQSNLALLAGLLVLIAGCWMVIHGRLSVGALLAFYAAATLLRGFINSALAAIPPVILGQRSLEGLDELLEEQERPPYEGRRIVAFDGAIELRDVEFRYPGKLVLEGVNLRLDAGSSVALLGPNGSGKSTLVRLILGFYRPQCGALYASGVAYDELDVRHLRRHFAAVPQEPQFFPGTISENLAYGSKTGSRTAAEAALELAGARGWLRELPRGLDTPIGEDGLRLSGGQRQRLALARAMLRRPKLLILDEPANHLDHASLVALLGSLKALPGHPTVLVISHHEAVIGEADEVWELGAIPGPIARVYRHSPTAGSSLA